MKEETPKLNNFFAKISKKNQMPNDQMPNAISLQIWVKSYKLIVLHCLSQNLLKELSLCHKLGLLKTNFFKTKCRRP